MKKLILIVVAIITVLVLTHVYFQDSFIFQGTNLEQNHKYSFTQKFEEHFIEVAPAIQINALWFKPEAQSKGLIIYFHGNAGNLHRWGEVAGDFTELGYELLIMDYRGYGKSGGKPNEKVLYDDAKVLWNWTQERTDNDHIIIYGRSLGAAIAAQLATQVEAQMVILETPFHELRGAVSFLLKPVITIFPLNYTFPTKEYLKEVKEKVFIFHGTRDLVVPLTSALKLREALKAEDEFIVVEGATHDNIGTFQIYKDKMRQLLK
jgi:uncharacterized protein